MSVYRSISEAYLGILEDVYRNPDHVHPGVEESQLPQGQDPNWLLNRAANQEKIDYRFTILSPSDREPIQTRSEKRNAIIEEYARKETEFFDRGDRVGIKSLSKVWERVQNPSGDVNANYGYMVYHLKDAGNTDYDPTLLSQWEWAKSRLRLHKNTNQAYLHFNRPKDQWEGNLDQPCCLAIQFQVRDDRLHLTVFMRSNDLVYGVPYNTLYFVKLMHRMVAELRAESGSHADLTVGDYHYHSASLHFYLKHTDLVREMLGEL